jgi:hypothetical protein
MFKPIHGRQLEHHDPHSIDKPFDIIQIPSGLDPWLLLESCLVEEVSAWNIQKIRKYVRYSDQCASKLMFSRFDTIEKGNALVYMESAL